MLNSISQIRAATSPNTRQKDAPHFYISWSLHCVRPPARCYATSIAGDRNDFFPMDVIRHAARAFAEMSRWSTPFIDFATMPDGVHNDGVLRFEDFKDDTVRTFPKLV